MDIETLLKRTIIILIIILMILAWHTANEAVNECIDKHRPGRIGDNIHKSKIVQKLGVQEDTPFLRLEKVDREE